MIGFSVGSVAFSIAVREAKIQGKVTGISGVEVIDNPFDFGKKFITGLGNKNKERYPIKKKKQKNKHAAKDIQKYLDDGWQLQSYSKSPPT
jgi:hypothetical protein